MSPYPILLIVLGAIVLFMGRRISVLGAAVGALLAVGLMNLFPGELEPIWEIVFVVGLAAGGFILSGLAKGIVDIVLLVLCTLAGAAIAMGFLDLFTEEFGWIGWIFVLVGGLVGLMLFRRFHEGAMIVLAGIIGGLLVTRGLTAWMPFLEGWLGTVLVIVLAGAGIGLQGGYFANRKAAKEAQAAQAAAAPAAATPATVTPAQSGDPVVPTTPPPTE